MNEKNVVVYLAKHGNAEKDVDCLVIKFKCNPSQYILGKLYESHYIQQQDCLDLVVAVENKNPKKSKKKSMALVSTVVELINGNNTLIDMLKNNGFTLTRNAFSLTFDPKINGVKTTTIIDLLAYENVGNKLSFMMIGDNISQVTYLQTSAIHITPQTTFGYTGPKMASEKAIIDERDLFEVMVDSCTKCFSGLSIFYKKKNQTRVTAPQNETDPLLGSKK